jgi:RimJ/RimL family protein N-acetyltransferase
MILETERLILRPFNEGDAEVIYESVQDERIGYWCGWPVHKSIEETRNIIKNVLMDKENYAVILKSENKLIGSAGIKLGKSCSLSAKDNEGEIGYWISVPYWRQGFASEATNELIRRSFEDLKLDTLWCGYYKGNEKSKGVQEKCGFTFHHILKDVNCSLLNEIRTEYVSILNHDTWEKLQSTK